MLTLTHRRDTGTVLDCPHRADLVAPVLRPIGWRPHPGGIWRLSGTRGRPADPRRVELTARALRRHGFTVTSPAMPVPPHALAAGRPQRPRPARAACRPSTATTRTS